MKMQSLVQTVSARKPAASSRERRAQAAVAHGIDFNNETRRAILEAYDDRDAVTFASVADALAYLHRDA